MPTTQVHGCSRRLAPTLPRQVMRERSRRAGEWMLPAALMTVGACWAGRGGARRKSSSVHGAGAYRILHS